MKLFGYPISVNVIILIGILYLIMIINALSASCNREGLSMGQKARDAQHAAAAAAQEAASAQEAAQLADRQAAAAQQVLSAKQVLASTQQMTRHAKKRPW